MPDDNLAPPFYPQSRLYAAGDQALVVEFGDSVDENLSNAVLTLDEILNTAPPAGLIETVPTYRSLLINFDPLVITRAELAEKVSELIPDCLAGEIDTSAHRRWRVPVCYGGEFGEDLDFVAEQSGMTPAQVIELHASGTYRVFMIGFAPGYTYLGGLAPELALPRREHPRGRIPAGSVAIAGGQACIFSMAVPSGWHMLGRTPETLFVPERASPCLFSPGDQIEFYQADPADWDRLKAEVI